MHQDPSTAARSFPPVLTRTEVVCVNGCQLSTEGFRVIAMALSVQELAQEVREPNKRLTDTVQRLADSVHDLEGAARKLESLFRKPRRGDRT